MKNRQDALDLLREYLKNENLIKHCFAVESAMKFYALKFKEDECKWALTGLLHDIDYEISPEIEKHSLEGARILEKNGFDPEIVNAVKVHNKYHKLPIDSLLAKTLLAVDELTGLITAAALIRPSKSLEDLKVKSVKKRMKEKSFAKSVNRDEIIEGSELINVPLDDHIANVIDAMKQVSKDLGL